MFRPGSAVSGSGCSIRYLEGSCRSQCIRRNAAADSGRPCAQSGGPRLVRPRHRIGAAAVLARLQGPRHRVGAPRVQPRAGDPGAQLLHVPARDEVRPAPRAARDRPLAGGHRHGRGADAGAPRQPGADRRSRLLFPHHLGGRAGARLLRVLPRHLLLAGGAAPRLHAAAAAVPLLEDQHRAAVPLLGDRRLLRALHGRAGLPRRQRHRPRGLQADGGRGLLRPALPLPDHELLLRLRRALHRGALAQDRAPALGGADRGPDERAPHRGDRSAGRPLRHRPGGRLPALLRGLDHLPLLHRAALSHGAGHAAAERRPPAARRGDRPRLHRARGPARPRRQHRPGPGADRRRASDRGAVGGLDVRPGARRRIR